MIKKSRTHKERVYTIARQLMFDSGGVGWSMDDLSREAGITKRTLYKIVASKEQLIGELVLDAIDEVQERIAAHIAAGGVFHDTARSLIIEYPLLMGRMSSPVISNLFMHYPEVEKLVIARRNELAARLIAFFDQGIASEHLRSDLSGAFILQLFQAMVLYFLKTSEGSETFSHNIVTAFDVLMDGLTAKAGSTGEAA